MLIGVLTGVLIGETGVLARTLASTALQLSALSIKLSVASSHEGAGH